MKLIFTACLLCICFTSSLHAQKKNKKDDAVSLYLFNEKWNPATNLEFATYFMEMVKENDTTFLCRYYNKYGPIVKQESYKDKDLTIPNGTFIWYNKTGYIDTIGIISNGHKDKEWTYYREQNVYKSIIYKDARLFEKKDYEAGVYVDSTGKQSDIKEKKLKDSLYWDSVKQNSKGEQDQIAAMPDYNWNDYIAKNLKTPDRMTNILGVGNHGVKIMFSIGKEGYIQDVILLKSLEWSADREVFRLLKDAPKWKSAQQRGKPVIFRNVQTVYFAVQEQ